MSVQKQIAFCSGPCEGRKSATLGSSLPKAFPLGGRWAGEAGSDEGAIWYPTFPCRTRKGGSRLSPQRNASSAPLGKSIAPSSVTFGDSFPPRGSLWVVQPYTKKRPKSGHVHGLRNSPTTAPLRPTTPKRASGSKRAIKMGGRGPTPATLCVRAFSRESLDPRPGPGGNPPRRSGPATVQTETTCQRQRPPAPRWGAPKVASEPPTQRVRTYPIRNG